ncbi:MAG: RagB/SusD family nutrient uptake outer membrane protein [Ferruginibacter sp.]
MKKIFEKLNTALMALAVLLTLGTTWGCKKFLDRQPLTATLDDLSAGGIEQQVFALYASQKESSAFGGIMWQALHNFRADDSEKGSDLTDGADWVASFDNFKYDKDHWCTNTYWDDHYSIINRANTILQLADSLDLSDPNTEIYRAEARFMRAYMYFDMVRVFGEVPLIDFRVYEASQAVVKKGTVPEINKFIEDDLLFAIEKLPGVWESKYLGRTTKYAAMTLLAKCYLFQGNFAAAYGYTEQVRTSGLYSLFPTYFGIFKDANENCSESIFEIQCGYIKNTSEPYGGNYFATCQGIRGKPDESPWNLGWGWNTPTDALVNTYEAGDIRKQSTILFGGQSDDPATGGYGKTIPANGESGLVRNYWNKKTYADPAAQAANGIPHAAWWVNQRVFRFADIMLMSAECKNEMDGASSADSNFIKGLVNDVRRRAGLRDTTYASQSEMRKIIKHERRVELALEGERFFDLVRWGDAETVLKPLGYEKRSKYYPVPKGVVEKSNGIIAQNPDYP